ncbi:MAG: holin family protein [Desulfobulbaceae bacterium]|nr:holin family protein [Desulfobulbaceae bacterium]
MSDGILSKIINGIAAVAPTVANMVVPGSGPVLHNLMRSVTGASPDTPIDQVAAEIDAHPELFVELQRAAMDHEVRMAKVEASKLAVVNATMQAEAKSEHWPQYSWRPFNGFLYGIAVVAIYFVLPLIGKVVPPVPEFIWVGWGAILGVTTWGRGKEKRAKAGDIRPGMIESAIKAIRGNGGG